MHHPIEGASSRPTQNNREHIPIGRNRDVLSILVLAHILFGKPVPTFPGYALAARRSAEIGGAIFHASCRLRTRVRTSLEMVSARGLEPRTT